MQERTNKKTTFKSANSKLMKHENPGCCNEGELESFAEQIERYVEDLYTRSSLKAWQRARKEEHETGEQTFADQELESDCIDVISAKL